MLVPDNRATVAFDPVLHRRRPQAERNSSHSATAVTASQTRTMFGTPERGTAGNCNNRGVCSVAGREQRDADDQSAIDHTGKRQGRHQRRHAQEGNTKTVQQTGQQSRRNGSTSRSHSAQARQQRRAKDAAQRRHSPHRQIKSLAARCHRHCLAQGEQAEKRRDLELVGDLRYVEKAGQQDLPAHQQRHAKPHQ